LGNYTWRIDLCKTEKHWPGWFQGLSKKFLSIHAQKLLLLANIDRMDKDLTVGQMQGNIIIYIFFFLLVLSPETMAISYCRDCLVCLLVGNTCMCG